LRGDLDAITLKALEKHRPRRYASPSEFAADIGRFLGNQPVLARQPSLGYRAKKFVIRHTGSVVAAATVLFILIVGILTTAWQARLAQQERLIAIREKNEAVARQLAADASLLAQKSPVNDSSQLTLGDRIRSATPFLFDSNSLLSKLLELILETYELHPPLGQMTGSSVAFSPDGRFVASAQSNDLKVIDIATRGELWRLKIDARIRDMGLSSDGSSLWLLTADGIRVIETSTGKQVGGFVLEKGYTPVGLSTDRGSYSSILAGQGGTPI
jgi:hypothetical protein